MKRLTSLFILILFCFLSSCDSPVSDNGNAQAPVAKLGKARLAPPAISYSKQPIRPDTARRSLWAQFQAHNGPGWRVRWNKHTGLPASLFLGLTKKAYRGSAEDAARAFLGDHASLLGFGALKNLRYVKTITYKGIRYVTFNEVVKDVPVYEAQYVVHLTASGQVAMVNGTYYPSLELSTTPSVAAAQAVSAAKADLKGTIPADLQSHSKLVVWHGPKQFHLAWKLELFSQDTLTDRLYMVDAHSGEILYTLNLVTDFSSGRKDTYAAWAPFSNASRGLANVITGDGNVYPTYPPGSSITNKPLPRLNGNGYLDGKYAYIVNDKASRAQSGSESFIYAPFVTHFDEVNLYYHIDKFRQGFIDQFGSDTEIGFTQITAHAHGSPNANAGFKLSNQELYFGDGSNSSYNDFARSDQVIYHEYGHAVIYHINSQIYSSSNEEGAISEGTPDYFAGSFSTRALSGDYVLANYPSQQRNMANPQPIDSYSEYESNEPVEPHDGGEFFSSILWDLRGDIGAGKTDELVYKTLHGISNGPDFLEFRDVMMDKDQFYYNGSDVNNIQTAFGDKGVGSSPPPAPVVTVSVTGPQTIHKGSQGTYTATASGGTSPYYYFWNFVYLDCAPGSPDCSKEGVQQFGAVGQTFDVPYTANYDKIKIEAFANDSGTPSHQGNGNKIAIFEDHAYIMQH